MKLPITGGYAVRLSVQKQNLSKLLVTFDLHVWTQLALGLHTGKTKARFVTCGVVSVRARPPRITRTSGDLSLSTKSPATLTSRRRRSSALGLTTQPSVDLVSSPESVDVQAAVLSMSYTSRLGLRGLVRAIRPLATKARCPEWA